MKERKTMANNSKYGSFVPTTNIYDLEGIDKKNLKPEDMQTLLVRLRQTINTIALSSNTKFSGHFVLEEFVNGNLWFKDPELNSTTEKAATLRQEHHIVINFGALPNSTTKSVAHGLNIQDSWTFVRQVACATDPVAHTSIGIPFSIGSGGAGGIDISAIKWSDTTIGAGTSDFIGIDIDDTNVNITTGSDRTSYTRCVVVLSYIKE